MVKIISNVKDGYSEASVEMAGNMATIASELANAIGGVYMQIGAQDKKAARAFRRLFTKLVTSEDSPMWIEGNCEGVTVNASIIRAGKLTSEDVANAIRSGASKDAIKALLEEM